MELSNTLLDQYRDAFSKDSKKRLVQLGVIRNGIVESAEKPEALMHNQPIFSVDLKTGKVPNQMHSGRCWLFAAMNILRDQVAKTLHAEPIELSQTYLYFYDKLEKANFFYENIVNTADRPVDDRLVAFLLDRPADDGGQWDMVVSLIQKYGIVPQTVMPDMENSRATDDLNKYLKAKLRRDAQQLRRMVSTKASEQDIQNVRQHMLNEVYSFLAISLGTPPTEFDFEYRCQDGDYHRLPHLTGPDFYTRFGQIDLDEYVPVINAPMENKKYQQVYTVDCLGNVVGGKQVKYLNLEMTELKNLAINQLKRGEPVWFGCDIGQYTNRKLGIMSRDTYDIAGLFDIDYQLTKADQLTYHHSLLTHAMVLTGVDLVEEHPTKWKVLNSWGEEVGFKGYFVMSDDWMSQYVYQVVIRKDLLPDNLMAIYEQAPQVLSAWDPMGSLA